MDPEELTLGEARSLLRKRLHRTVSMATLYRWIKVGCKKGGKLAVQKIGGRYAVTRDAVEEFIERCTRESGVQPVKTLA